MKIDKNKITIARFIQVPCYKCDDLVRSYLRKLSSSSEGSLSIDYKPRYSFKEENDYIDYPLCKECFQFHNIKK